MAFTKTPMSPAEQLEANRAKARRDYEKNKEKRRAVQNARKRADPEKTRADARARRAAKPEQYRAYGRKEQAIRREKYPWLASFHSRRKHAAKKGIPFTITTDWCKAIYTGQCSLTGIAFDTRACDQVGNPGPRPYSISIDKIEAAKGYTPENSRFVLNAVNTMRGSGTDAEMLKVVSALLTHKGEPHVHANS